MVKKTKRMGVQGELLSLIQSKFNKGEQFNHTSFHVEGACDRTVQNALWNLHNKGLICKGSVKGFYFLGLKGIKKEQPNPAQTIYDLLDYMAKAEPALKRAAKILEAVDAS
jgi:hypothetical protein